MNKHKCKMRIEARFLNDKLLGIYNVCDGCYKEKEVRISKKIEKIAKATYDQGKVIMYNRISSKLLLLFRDPCDFVKKIIE